MPLLLFGSLSLREGNRDDSKQNRKELLTWTLSISFLTPTGFQDSGSETERRIRRRKSDAWLIGMALGFVKEFLTWCVNDANGFLLALEIHVDHEASNGLCDPSLLSGDHICMSESIDQSRLAVIDVTHDGDDGGSFPEQQKIRGVEFSLFSQT